ncbi:MAG: acyl-[acyl-carrier-protein]--UDP-N-acetylglucosamine O-acyltransferase [Opitutia bacterium]|nr:MAG: acyl-[acyl-carrier-protein]--UDP-N-acetylglucosamine O-acyltransferase [Opitutae bacterium]
MSSTIHPTAIVEEGAQIGAGCAIMAYAIVTRHSVLGDGVVIHPFAVVGGDPQYLKFDATLSTSVRIGPGTVIREHVTINRSIHAGKATTVGAGCFLMANAHVAHDCAVADHVVLANNAMVAGHVEIGAHTFVGGGAGLHQFCRIGEGVMVAGNAAVTRDVPHFTLVAERDEVIGFNVVGLKRRGFSRAAMAELKGAFQEVYCTAGNIREVAAGLAASGRFGSAEAQKFLAFFSGGKRSFARARRAVTGETEA